MPEKKNASKPGKDAADKKSQARITRETVIGEAARSSSEAAEIMFGYGLHCLGCGMVAYETIEQGCSVHGMSDEEIDRMVEELNDAMDREKEQDKIAEDGPAEKS